MSGSDVISITDSAPELGSSRPRRAAAVVVPGTRSARGRESAPAPTSHLLPLDEVANLPVDATIVIPTFNERETVSGLIRSLERLLVTLPYRTEVLVVDDDSPDGTADVVRGMPTRVPTRILVRHEEKGLASAVLVGLRAARGRVCLVMDVDGSHPPELVPTLLAPVLEGRAEMSLASRYVPGGATGKDWPLSRRVMSRAATALARPLTAVHDPMTGFFAVDPHILDRGELSPIGYKICLEILVRCRPRSVVEVPFLFLERRAGESKMGGREVLRYARHLSRLYAVRLTRPFRRSPPSASARSGARA